MSGGFELGMARDGAYVGRAERGDLGAEGGAMADVDRAKQPITKARRVGVLVGVGAVGAALDLWSKAAVFADPRWADGKEHPVAGGWGVVHLAYNPGAVWGIFGSQTDVLTVASALALPLLVWLALREPRPSLDFVVALGLVLGGAVGNLYDRVAFAKVRDFIGVYLGSYRWPTFNLADSWISIGVVWLLIRELFGMGADSGPQGSTKSLSTERARCPSTPAS